jgi:alpha-1,6-mannosyltransferase
MRLCDVVEFHSPISGGVKRYLGDKIAFCAARPDVEHTVLVPAASAGIRREGRSRIVGVRSPRVLGSRSYRVMASRRRLRALIDAARPDVIEVDNAYRSAWVALEAGRARGAPVVAFYHSDFPRAIGRTIRRFAGRVPERCLGGAIERYLAGLYNRMDATVAASRQTAGLLQRLGVRRIAVIPLGVDTARFRPRDARDRVRLELGLPPGAPLLLFVGRLCREKNIRSLMDMADRLAASSSPAPRLLLVGDGELHDSVVARARPEGPVLWRPYTGDPDRLSDLYSAADVFVHAGMTETFGLVSVEAQACGARVVAVRGGGLDSTLAPEEARGFAEDPGPDALAAACRRVLAAADTPAARARRRERVVREFSIDRTFERLFALYDVLRGRDLAGRDAGEFIDGVPGACLRAG